MGFSSRGIVHCIDNLADFNINTACFNRLSHSHVWTITQTPAEYQDKININTATIDELTYAEGIGPSTAKNIYDYLQQKGPVDSIDDLDSVPGIGEKRLEALKKIFYAG